MHKLIEAARLHAPGLWQTAFSEACFEASNLHNWDRALELFDIAAKNSEGESYNYWWHTALLLSKRQFSHGIHVLKRTLQHQRTSLALHLDLMLAYIMSGNYGEADKVAETVSNFVSPAEPAFAAAAALFFEAQNDTETAVLQFNAWMKIAIKTPDWPEQGRFNPLDLAILSFVLARNGETDIPTITLERYCEEHRTRERVGVFPIALILVGLGRYDEAVEWLRRAADDHDPYAMWFHIYPPLRHLRGHKAYRDLLRDLKLDIPQRS